MKKKEKESEEKEGKGSIVVEMINTVLYILIVLALTILFVKFVAQRTYVSGNSMNNMLYNGDNLIVDKISYRFHDPERFDIIVFPYQYKEDTYYIKRIIGLPGETVQIIDGFVYINGEKLNESYGREVMHSAGTAYEPITLEDNEYFVLGDNRNESADSRDPSVGIINRKDFIGKAWIRIWPLKDFGLIKHQ